MGAGLHINFGRDRVTSADDAHCAIQRQQQLTACSAAVRGLAAPIHRVQRFYQGVDRMEPAPESRHIVEPRDLTDITTYRSVFTFRLTTPLSVTAALMPTNSTSISMVSGLTVCLPPCPCPRRGTCREYQPDGNSRIPFGPAVVRLADLNAAVPPVAVQDRLHTLPSFGLDDGFVLAIVDLAFELDVAGVNRVRQ